jgi:Reverse transcriptase (RNA-dependent DNA polymerase)
MIDLFTDGTRLATASIKGTVVRVFSILSSGPPQLLQEFRRGIDRVQMTCLAWSWDHRHVACCSDKGTAHVFQLKETQTELSDASNTNNNDQSKEKNKSSKSSSWYKSIKQTIFSSDLKHSISQVCGIPHPITCTFVPNLPNTLAVVGWDIDGNGVVSLNDYSQEEAVRTGYHVIAKSAMDSSPSVADEGTTQRKRMLQSTKDHVIPNNEDSNEAMNPLVQIGDRMDRIHYNSSHTAAPITNDTTIRIMYTLAAMAKWSAYVVDINGAFLNGRFEKGETLYLKIPEGLEIFYKSLQVLKLNRTIYGLKQSAQAFWSELLKAMKAMGLIEAMEIFAVISKLLKID